MSETEITTRPVAAYVTDMIFASRIRATAQAVGRPLRAVTTMAQLQSVLDHQTPEVVLIDLSIDGPLPIDAVAIAKAHVSSPRVVAFCSHVLKDRMESAAAAGADDVWPRSKFTVELEDLLAFPKP